MEMNNLQTTIESTVPAIVITAKIAPRMHRERKAKDASEEEFKGRTPRITKLMALAIHLQDLVDNGVVRDYAEIARLASMTRARVSQIMNLTLLAPSIQEQILFMPKIFKGHDSISERTIREIGLIPCWHLQLKEWQILTQKISSKS